MELEVKECKECHDRVLHRGGVCLFCQVRKNGTSGTTFEEARDLQFHHSKEAT